ncbi:MAG: DUF4272 domain-containing protein [Deltaproteobacteria bacterium]|nr:DUF4272 domain-containing protein [Deltaproteobacteria bacterium]
MTPTKPKDAADVARRCLCLELLVQRLGLEVDDGEPKESLEAVRKSWLRAATDLELEPVLLADERGYLEREVGSLEEDERDDVHGRVTAALVLLWALGKLPARPELADVQDALDRITTAGLLGDGSVSAAKATILSAKLRPVGDLRAAYAAYTQARGKMTDDDTPEQIVGNLGSRTLAWVLDREQPYDDDYVMAAL